MDEVADMVEELPVSKSDLKLLVNKVTIHPRTHMVEWNDMTIKVSLTNIKE